MAPNAQVIVGAGPVKSSGTMGAVERFSRSLQGIARTLAIAMQGRWDWKIRSGAPLMLVRHAAFLHNHFQVRASGLTPYEEMRGEPYRVPLHSWASPVQVRKPGAQLPGARLERRWLPGLWMGRRSSTGEHLVATANGLVAPRACRADVT